LFASFKKPKKTTKINNLVLANLKLMDKKKIEPNQLKNREEACKKHEAAAMHRIS
jgi:hypothetical protein